VSFLPEALTQDAFLGGRVALLQPRGGYRAGIEPVLLAASVPAAPGDRVLELGTGSGVALLCLAARVPDLALSGIELQPDYADLARRNGALNGVALEVVEGDLARMPAILRQRRFDRVLMNPPFFDASGHTPPPDPGRGAARRHDGALGTWFAAAAARLSPRGTLSAILRAEALPAALAALPGHVGSVEAKPLSPRTGRDARLVLLRAVKGGRAQFRLLAPLVLHEGERHEGDGESFRPEAQAILRHGAALIF
jgi:tRNA1Val (adenine37-N6)-methyltransferase